MSSVVIAIFLLSIGASFVQRTTGFGFGIFIMTMLPFFLPTYGEATTLSGLLAITTSAVIVWRMRSYVTWKRLWPILLTFIVGITRGQTPCEVDTQTKESLSSTGIDSLDNSIIVERMLPYGCSNVTCRGKVIRLQGVNDVGTGRETISRESAAGVSFISSGRC